MKLLLVVITILTTNFGFAQDSTAFFRIPPGAIIKEKSVIKINMDKLHEDIMSRSSDEEIHLPFIKKISEEEWNKLEQNDTESFAYFSEALEYYNQLSNRVKAALTAKELWSIYVYMPKIREKLLTY